MRFSLCLNSEFGPTVEAVKLAVQAEKQGLDCVWYCQDLFQRDAWVFLTAAAAHTEQICLGTCVVNPYTVSPAELAMHAATLDEYSKGRLRLGISAGAVEFLKWVGIDADHPLSAVREAVELIRRLMGAEQVVHNGELFKGWTRDAYLRFKPWRSRIPIYIGAQKQHMLELAGEIGDGSLPLLFPPEYIEDVLKHISAGAARANRRLEDLDVVGCIWFSLSRDPEAATDALRGLISYYGPHLARQMIGKAGLTPEDFAPIKEALSRRDYAEARRLVTDKMAQLAVHGTPDDCLERIKRLERKGLTHIRFGPPLGPDPEEAIRLIGREIIPNFKK